MSQLAQGFGFDLANALAGHREVLSDFFKRVFAPVGTEAEPHFDYLFFARSERLQDFFGDFSEISGDYGVGWIGDGSVFDEVAQVRVFFFTYGSLERDRLLRNLQNLSHLGNGNVHLLGDLFGAGLAAEFLNQGARSSDQFVDCLDHVNGNSNRTSLIGNGSGNGLADPPCRIGRELVATPPLKLVDGFHQSDVAFLDQVKELQTAVGVFLRYRYHQSEICLDQLLFGNVGLALAGVDCCKRALEL